MRDSHPSRGILMGMRTKLLKLIEIRWEWEFLVWEWVCLLLMCFHFVIIFPPKSVLDLIYLSFYMVFCTFCCYLVILVYASQFFVSIKSNIINCVKVC